MHQSHLTNREDHIPFMMVYGEERYLWEGLPNGEEAWYVDRKHKTFEEEAIKKLNTMMSEMMKPDMARSSPLELDVAEFEVLESNTTMPDAMMLDIPESNTLMPYSVKHDFIKFFPLSKW